VEDLEPMPIDRLRTADELAAALDDVRASPREAGEIHLIVVRPAKHERRVLEAGVIDPALGLVGDCWSTKTTAKRKVPNPNAQLTVMNIRALRAICDEPDWALAGDNLCVDLDVSHANLPAGTRLLVGEAELEVTADPHTGCSKFTKRFGSEATKWVNSKAGRELNLRGINVKVIRGGAFERGDSIRKA
jgi:hypothetical protein